MVQEDLPILTAKMILSRNLDGLRSVNGAIAELPEKELKQLWKIVKQILTMQDIEWFHQSLEMLSND